CDPDLTKLFVMSPMMNLRQVLSSDLSLRLGRSLAHSLWQGLVAASLLAIALRALRPCSPRVRYSAALGTLALLLGAVAVTFCAIAPGSDEAIAVPAVGSTG